MGSNPSDKSAVTFRGTLNGYNKNDVNQYIEEMNMKFSDTESEYKKILLIQKKQIDELNLNLFEIKAGMNELTALREKNKSIQTELEKAENERINHQKKSSEYNAAIGTLNDRYNQLSAEYDILIQAESGKAENERVNNQKKNSEYNAVIDTLNDRNSQLSAEYDILKENFKTISRERDTLLDKITQIAGERDEIKRELRTAAENTAVKPAVIEQKTITKTTDPPDVEKARIYDKISRQVGSMLIDAREIADNIIDDANIQAKKIITSAENKAGEIYSDADIKFNQTLKYIKNTLKRMSSDCMSEYIEHINNSRSALDKLLGDTSAGADAVYAQFDTIINNTLLDLNKGIDKITSPVTQESANSSNESDTANPSRFSE